MTCHALLDDKSSSQSHRQPVGICSWIDAENGDGGFLKPSCMRRVNRVHYLSALRSILILSSQLRLGLTSGGFPPVI